MMDVRKTASRLSRPAGFLRDVMLYGKVPVVPESKKVEDQGDSIYAYIQVPRLFGINPLVAPRSFFVCARKTSTTSHLNPGRCAWARGFASPPPPPCAFVHTRQLPAGCSTRPQTRHTLGHHVLKCAAYLNWPIVTRAHAPRTTDATGPLTTTDPRCQIEQAYR